MDIGTRKIYNEDHDMFRETCRKFWASIDMDRVRKWEELRGATPDIWKEAGAAGLLCMSKYNFVTTELRDNMFVTNSYFVTSQKTS